MRELAELAARIAEVERRQQNLFRHGTVERVDPAKALMRLRLGETNGQPFISPWVPYAQIAGALKVHTPPSVGQQMTLMSPTGDFRQAVALPLTWSDHNASPSQAGNEHVLTFGNVRITIRGNVVTIKSPLVLVQGDVRIEGRLHTTQGIHDNGGVFSKAGVWPPLPVFVPPVEGG